MKGDVQDIVSDDFRAREGGLQNFQIPCPESDAEVTQWMVRDRGFEPLTPTVPR
jgi:hypothetical protein